MRWGRRKHEHRYPPRASDRYRFMLRNVRSCDRSLFGALCCLAHQAFKRIVHRARTKPRPIGALPQSGEPEQGPFIVGKARGKSVRAEGTYAYRLAPRGTKHHLISSSFGHIRSCVSRYDDRDRGGNACRRRKLVRKLSPALFHPSRRVLPGVSERSPYDPSAHLHILAFL